jgi:NIPSNAP
MIYEFRTYSLRVRALPETLKVFGEALPDREQYSRLAAFWYTEIGPLNQIIQVWGYDSLDERSRIRAEALKGGNWPPKLGKMISTMKSEIMIPAPCSPQVLSPANIGPYFEMRRYTLKPGSGSEQTRRWAEHLPARQKHSPLVGVFMSEIGDLNLWVSIWAYTSLDQRMAIRQQLRDEGTWPPPGDTLVSHQESKLMLAAPFSPIK